jgi:hypothetical protein
MKHFLRLAPELYFDLRRHLFPSGGECEEAAFLCVTPTTFSEGSVFEVVDQHFAKPDDFVSRESDYLELTDEARMSLIQRAHRRGASLVEIHSHLGPYAAAFSPSDRMGLRETVPHMRWRLKNRPYVALVFAESGFDALVWTDDPARPTPLEALLVGDQTLSPTHLTYRGWHGRL